MLHGRRFAVRYTISQQYILQLMFDSKEIMKEGKRKK
jgi:hypothetical protein